jgi:hypothetical protein
MIENASLASAVWRRWPQALVPLAALLFMAVCHVLYQPLWERAFRSDNSPVSWLSGALLFANAVVALVLVLTAAMPPRLGRLMAGGLLWCALDEQFMFHERFKYDYAPSWFAEEAALPSWLLNLPMIAVGLGGAVCIAWFLRRMWRGNIVACGLMLTALAVGVLALAVDLWGDGWAIAPFEEALEVLAESFFLSALLETAQVQSASCSKLSSNH